MRERVFIGLGANLGDPERALAEAAEALGTFPETSLVGRSSLYAAAPLGAAQPEFRNAVVELVTPEAPEGLLRRLLAVEQAQGRIRRERWGPRVLDLDILLWGERILSLPELRIPHPELHRRRFVLEPLAEVDPSVRHPVLGKTVAELLADVRDQDVRRIASQVWTRR
jgi:2-amino-4-hydroxy-6-hydroxymethyldihydropteridine diphosphokinase